MAAPPDREAVRGEYLRRVIPQFNGHQFNGHQVDDITWTTAHGDLHYGNVTRGPHVLNWQGWGRAPYGYDAATLYVYALLIPRYGRPHPIRAHPRPGPARGPLPTADRLRPGPPGPGPHRLLRKAHSIFAGGIAT